MLNDDIKQSVAYKGRGKGLIKRGGMVINAGSKQMKAPIKKKNINITLDDNITDDDEATRLAILFNEEEERKRREELMAKERNTTLMIEKDVDADVDDTYKAQRQKKLKRIENITPAA
ncbi:hypothetical protein Tco_0772283 [Tanacetum coccineum]|uniref:Uncharacterized protein n=1 Tax=Tanacetum coccineum TaxID=301880 RepID=A0ABQ4ZKD7_9ASTR